MKSEFRFRPGMNFVFARNIIEAASRQRLPSGVLA